MLRQKGPMNKDMPRSGIAQATNREAWHGGLLIFRPRLGKRSASVARRPRRKKNRKRSVFLRAFRPLRHMTRRP